MGIEGQLNGIVDGMKPTFMGCLEGKGADRELGLATDLVTL